MNEYLALIAIGIVVLALSAGMARLGSLLAPTFAEVREAIGPITRER